MAMEILTKDDLEQFKQEFFNELRAVLNNNQPQASNAVIAPAKWLKSYEVQRLLKISESTLQTLRKNGLLPFTKIGCTLFYDENDITEILKNNKIHNYQIDK